MLWIKGVKRGYQPRETIILDHNKSGQEWKVTLGFKNPQTWDHSWDFQGEFAVQLLEPEIMWWQVIKKVLVLFYYILLLFCSVTLKTNSWKQQDGSLLLTENNRCSCAGKHVSVLKDMNGQRIMINGRPASKINCINGCKSLF